MREQIDEQAAAIGRLTEKADLYRERAEFMDNLNQDLKDGFIDAIIEGENFGDVLADVAKMLAKAALQAALFNEGIFRNEGGGGGLFGNLLGSASSWIFGKRALGGPAQAGMPYLVNERHRTIKRRITGCAPLRRSGRQLEGQGRADQRGGVGENY